MSELTEDKKTTWIQRRLLQPLLAFLKQGMSPQKLALAVTCGSVISTFPVFGSHSLLCIAVVFLFRINAGAVFLINNFTYPLIFVTYLPLIRAGEWVFNAPKMAFSIPQIFGLFKDNIFQAITTLWDATIHAIVAWSLIVSPIGFIIYFILYKTFSAISSKQFIVKD